MKVNGLQLKFVDFHAKNPHVYELFERYTFDVIRLGIKKIGAKMIMERLRWEIMFETTDVDFKINNTLTAYYARHFVSKNPDFKYIFNFKKVREEGV